MPFLIKHYKIDKQFEVGEFLQCFSIKDYDISRGVNKISLIRKQDWFNFYAFKNGYRPKVILRKKRNGLRVTVRQRVISLPWIPLTVVFLLVFIVTHNIEVLIGFLFGLLIGVGGFYSGYLQIKNDVDSIKHKVEKIRSDKDRL